MLDINCINVENTPRSFIFKTSFYFLTHTAVNALSLVLFSNFFIMFLKQLFCSKL